MISCLRTRTQELTFAGFVDPNTDMLTVNERPFNVFAHIASGKLRQPALEAEQSALGAHSQKFMICANRPDNDLHWDSTDPKWIQKASMAKRQRLCRLLSPSLSLFVSGFSLCLRWGPERSPSRRRGDARARPDPCLERRPSGVPHLGRGCKTSAHTPGASARASFRKDAPC